MRKKTMLLGLGLDAKDGHTRITKGDNFHLVGGSKETHEEMQEKVIKINEKLGSRDINDVSPKELLDIISKVCD